MNSRTKWFLVAFAGVWQATALLAVQTDFERHCAALAARRGDHSARLRELFDLDWAHSLEESPEMATEEGYPGQNARWTDDSPEAIEARKRDWKPLSEVLETIDRNALSGADQLNFDLFKRNVAEAETGSRFPVEFMAITPLSGVQQSAAETLDLAPRASLADYEDILARLRALPKRIDQTIALLRRGVEAGITPPRITLRDVPAQVRNQMENDPAKSPLLRAFQQFPEVIRSDDRERLRRAAAAALKEEVIPAFGRLHEFLVQSYLPRARNTIGLSELPDGRAWYAFNVKSMTTTSFTPQQIHELGLAEVKRIRAEMEAVIRSTGFRGDFSKFCKFLRTDRRFFFHDPEALLTAYRDICKRVDPELAGLFGKLPRLPYGVMPVPAYAEQSQTTAYYQPGSVQAGRAGIYYANTYALNTRPKWEMQALTLHESVPGHHLQISLAQEMQDVPEFRKHREYTAFVEGWALYAESLGTEMGFYRDPYSKFGQLTYEMWRAVRLVVDTGMHSLGWSRQQAIDYFLANTSKTEHDITVEVDRYIVWPGQALAYKLGELKIKELRALAQSQLGARFDVRRFHDHVLENGALPLDLLDQRMRDWIRSEQTANAGK